MLNNKKKSSKPLSEKQLKLLQKQKMEKKFHNSKLYYFKIFGATSILLFILILFSYILNNNIFDSVPFIDYKVAGKSLYYFLFLVFVSLFIFNCVVFTLFNENHKSFKYTWSKNKYVTLALLFALIAETTKLVPLLQPYSLAWFFGTQICLIIHCFKLRKFKKHDLWYLLVFIAIVGVVYCLIYKQLNSLDNSIINLLTKILVPCYLALVSITCWRALMLFNSNNTTLVVAITLFYTSDLLVISSLVVNLESIISVIVWFTYLPAIFLISTSVSTFHKHVHTGYKL